jgi:polyisoprenoid-binding protein YceI
MPSMTRLGCLVFALLSPLLLVAASSKPLASTQDAETIEFTLDPVHCMVNFRIHHAGAGMFWGRFNDVTGTFATSEDGSAAPSMNVSVAVDSVDTGTEKLDRTLMGPNFFDSKEFEKITFKSTKAEADGEGGWKLTGKMTMLGVTKEVTATVEMTGLKGNPVIKKAGYEATLTIKRSDFGMDWGVKNGALGDEVRLIIGLEGDWTA